SHATRGPASGAWTGALAGVNPVLLPLSGSASVILTRSPGIENNGIHTNREDLVQRTSRAMGRGEGPRPRACPALRLRRLRGDALLSDRRGPGRLQARCAPRSAVPIGGDVRARNSLFC